MKLLIKPDIDACGEWNVALVIETPWPTKRGNTRRHVFLPDSRGNTLFHSEAAATRVATWYTDALHSDGRPVIPVQIRRRRSSRRPRGAR